MKHGLMLRRPVAGQDPPELVAAWNRVFSRKWLAKDFIAPQLAPQLGRAHKMRGAVKASNTSYNGNAARGSGVVPETGLPPSARG